MLAPDIKSMLQRILAGDPGILFERLATEHAVPVRTVVEALPSELRRFADGDAFVPVMQDIAGWGEVTFIINNDDGIFEFSGAIPKGEVGRGYFNLMSRRGLHGHLRHDRCAALAFVERPFMNKHTASLLFFNPEGGTMFKVFVGRDETGKLREDQLAAFRALADRVCRPN